jgi:hypothetical protein
MAQIASAAPAVDHSQAPAADTANNARGCRHEAQGNLDLHGRPPFLHPHFLVNKSHKPLNSIEDGLNL